MAVYQTIFSDEMVKQFRKLSRNNDVKRLLSKMLDLLEERGPTAGNLLDSRLHLYELKQGSPSLRLYYRPREGTNKIDVFEYEIKKRKKQQNQTIAKLRQRISES